MVFSNKIVKLGKASKITGFAKRDLLTLYFCQEGNKVYTKKIHLNNKLSMVASSTYVNYTEILPLNENLRVLRLEENLWVENNE